MNESIGSVLQKKDPQPQGETTATNELGNSSQATKEGPQTTEKKS